MGEFVSAQPNGGDDSQELNSAQTRQGKDGKAKSKGEDGKGKGKMEKEIRAEARKE